MAQVITFQDFTPVVRYDSIPWTQANIEEGDTAEGPWTLIDTITLSPVDTDPEHPLTRSFTTELASDTPDLWYRITFLDGTGDDTFPTAPIQNTEVQTPYASIDELARILKIRNPTGAQTAAMQRVLIAAAGEIDAEINLAADVTLTGWQVFLAAEVNLERAVELWRLEETSFGIVGLGSEFGTSHIARNTWDKYAYTLAPLKNQWGLA